MKIGVSSTGPELESKLDPRLGRAAYFILVDTDTMDFEAIDNEASVAGGGAGIASGQLLIDRGIKAVITGNAGPNASNVLSTAGIEIYRGNSSTVKENVEEFKKSSLEKIGTTVDRHSGLNR